MPAILALALTVNVDVAFAAAGAGKSSGDAEVRPGARHWAFQPVAKPESPAVRDREWGQSPIDSFILARLESAGLRPAVKADRRTLIRRATFDLHGLPPTPAEVAAFEADDRPDAFARVVDRLLASPRYGERWGRHWLDVARFADTKGYVRLKENPVYVGAWTYRDYVIQAFNEDRPYDRFVLEQLAADQFLTGEDKAPLAAMGFLTLGQRFINSQHDIIDDRIDVVTRGLMGLSVTCARCHDHKFDPVSMRDYYGLHGVFANSIEPPVAPMVTAPADPAERVRYETDLRARTEKFDTFLREQHDRLTRSFRERAGEYLLAAQSERVQANFVAVMFLVDSAKDLNPVVIQRWGRLLEESRRKPHPALVPWLALGAIPPGEFEATAPGIIAGLAADVRSPAAANRVVLGAFERQPPRSLSDAAARYAEMFRETAARWQSRLAADPKASRLEDPDWEEIRGLLYGPQAPPDVPLAEIEECFFVDATTQNRFHEEQRQVEDFIASGRAGHALILVDSPAPRDSRLFIRGNPANPGAAVPRQAPELLSGLGKTPFPSGSGRLELARVIADPDNPLTGRVMVNRIWMHHFGAGLVRSPGDFGLRGEAPTHPELLDYLAWRFVEDGWSVKSLHRLIMVSAVYQQSSTAPPSASAVAGSTGDLARIDPAVVDPENRLWWRANRRRLDWEALRDSLLMVAGNLDSAMGGPSVNLLSQPFARRRSVYGFIDRQQLPALFRTFDFAAPDATSAQRHETTVPQQALFLMNSPFIKEQARQLAARPEMRSMGQPEERIRLFHRILYGREPAEAELRLGREFVGATAEGAAASESTGDSETLSPWEEYAQVLLLANEFTFVD